MRILILGCKDYPAFSTPWAHSGGMEVYTERMVRSLHDRARFTLYTAGGSSDEAARATALGAAQGLRTQPLSLLLRTRRELAREGPVYDLLNPQTPLSALAALGARRRWGIPYVVTVHVFSSDPAHAGSRPAAWLYARIERLVFSQAAIIIATGRQLGRFLEERHPALRSRVRVVTAAGTGTRETAERSRTRSRLGVASDAPLLLFLGRIVDENRIPELLQCVVRLRQGLPGLQLLIAGSGDREVETARLSRLLGLDGAVRIIPTLRGQEKFDVLGAADLLVRTSRHEVFPEAYLEALSVGTPVAATPAGDTADLAAASGAVALVPFGDPPAQALAIEELLRSPEKRARMRERALDYSRRVRWQEQKELYWQSLLAAAATT